MQSSKHSPSAAQSSIAICQYCGTEIAPLTFHFLGKTRTLPGQCECPDAIEARQQVEIERKKQEAMLKANELLARAKLPTGRDYRFANWNRNQYANADEYYRTVIEYVNSVQLGTRNWLFIYGPYGTGKTHLSVAALRQLIANHVLDTREDMPFPWRGLFVDWVSHCTAVQKSWSKQNDVDPNTTWRAMKGVEILVIDDIDKRKSSEWALGELFQVIQHRYNNCKPTIITANHSIKQLQELWQSSDKDYIRDVGGAILSRILGQLWRQVAMIADDQRNIV